MVDTAQLRVLVTVADLNNGDTVEIDGVYETVSESHLKRGFTGHTYKGDPHICGIVRVVFKVPTINGFRYR